jgi:hypothetical protein
MILPTRITPIERCLLAAGGELLSELERPKSISSLWYKVRERANLNSFSRFVLAIDLLFILGAAHIDQETGLLRRGVGNA